MPNTQAHTDIPSWVQKDPACRHAWQHDRSWRKAARRALHEVHILQLRLQARRDYGEASGVRRQASGEHHHADECPCNPCRKRRGEKALPSLRQLQEKRKRAIGSEPGTVGYEPGDREEWLLTADDRVRWTRLCEVFDDGPHKHFFVVLRTALAQHLDAWRLFGALERLLEERPSWGSALVACDLQGRRASAVAKEEGVPPKTVHHRRRCARRYLAALYAGEEPQRPHSPGPQAHLDRCAGTGATLAALEEAARLAQCPSVTDYVRRIVLEPL